MGNRKYSFQGTGAWSRCQNGADTSCLWVGTEEAPLTQRPSSRPGLPLTVTPTSLRKPQPLPGRASLLGANSGGIHSSPRKTGLCPGWGLGPWGQSFCKRANGAQILSLPPKPESPTEGRVPWP